MFRRIQDAARETKRVNQKISVHKDPRNEDVVKRIQASLEEKTMKAATHFLFCVCCKYASYQIRAPEYAKLLERVIRFNADARSEWAPLPMIEFDEDLPYFFTCIV
jgi:hypothetical protein